MKNLFSCIIAIGLMFSLVIGCKSSPNLLNSEKDQKNRDIKKEKPRKLEGSVIVYTSHPQEIASHIAKAFEAKTGVKVDIVNAGTNELLKRLRAEASNPNADIIFGGTAAILNSYSDLFLDYTPSNLLLDLPKKFEGQKDIGTCESYIAIMYNKNLVDKNDIPKSWNDLLDSKWRGKILYCNPEKSASAMIALNNMLTVFGKDDGKGWEFIKKLVPNLSICSKSSDVYKNVAKGDFPIGISFDEAIITKKLSGEPVDIIYPKEGVAHIRDLIKIVKNSKNQDNAKAFIDFVLTKEAQSIFVKLNRRPIISGIETPNLPLKESFKVIPMDDIWASKEESNNVNEWRKLIAEK